MMGLFSLVILIYCMLMLFYAFKFKSFISYDLEKKIPRTRFSIIVPFRNEDTYLSHLLNSLNGLNYPKNLFEIILVDDFSEDDSVAICKSWQKKNSDLEIKLLTNQNLAKSPKKSAVLTAIKEVVNDYIITTDADCVLPEDWLLHFDFHLQNHASDLVAGPVKTIENSRFWTKFQVLDIMSLQIIGLGSFKTPLPLFCNAANLCYKAKTLQDLQAFNQHKDKISGDDVFNLEVFQNHDKNIHAIVHQDAIVWTHPEDSFQSLSQQRIRWASKAKYYKSKWLKFLGLIVLLSNFALVLSLALAINFVNFHYFWWLWFFKICIDFYVLRTANQFFKVNLCLRDYLIMLWIYPFINLYIGLLSLTGKFSWKGRDYKI